MPSAQTPGFALHGVGGALQTTPAHGSPAQSPVAASQPLAHVVANEVNVQSPAGALQVPTRNEREVFASSQTGAGGTQGFNPPGRQMPSVSQVSCTVQPFASSHAVPWATGA